ncbi:MAG: transglutaminase-like domain-containing protein [Armatimonadota bacterium]
MKRVIILILLFLSVGAYAQEIPSETWMGIYLGAEKIGYASFAVDRAETGYRMESASYTRMLVMGTEVEQRMDSTALFDEQFRPVRQDFVISSGGHSVNISARFSESEIAAEFESGGVKNEKRIPIPPGSKIVGDNTFFGPGVQLNLGDKLDAKMFNPLTMTLDDVHVEVLRKEGELFVLQSSAPMGDVTCWQDEKGNLEKAVGIMGITMLRETKESALSGMGSEYTPVCDTAVATSTRTEKRIEDPRGVKYLKVRLSGLADSKFAVSDRWQKVKLVGDVAEYKISAETFDKSKSVSLPIEGEDYLDDTTYVQSKNPEIVKTAGKIVGNEKNAWRVVSLLRGWVHASMRANGEVGMLRTSIDVLNEKSGVCRDYAILYAALARAAGVPTKLVGGLVYWQDGFYYHAWAESYVGKWVPVDPTIPGDFVDATHIKLAEGDADVMFDMAKTVGAIKAEIVEYK